MLLNCLHFFIKITALDVILQQSSGRFHIVFTIFNIRTVYDAITNLLGNEMAVTFP